MTTRGGSDFFIWRTYQDWVKKKKLKRGFLEKETSSPTQRAAVTYPCSRGCRRPGAFELFRNTTRRSCWRWAGTCRRTWWTCWRDSPPGRGGQRKLTFLLEEKNKQRGCKVCASGSHQECQVKDVVLGQQCGLIGQQELEEVDERCAQSTQEC